MSNHNTKQYNKLLKKYNDKKRDYSDIYFNYIKLSRENTVYKICLIILSLICLLTFSTNAMSKDLNDSQLVKRNINSVVEIYDLSDGYSGSGSGFYLTSQLIITNKHVVNKNTKNYILKNKSGDMFEAKLLYSSGKHDISILLSEKKNKNYAPLCDYIPNYHQKIYSIGNSYSKAPYRIKYGHTTGLYNLSPVHDLDIKPGDSGSPIFDYNDHCVLGMNRAGFLLNKELIHGVYISNQFIYESWEDLIIKTAIQKAKKNKETVDE